MVLHLQAFYERERDRIFFKMWNCIGHHSRVPNVGSYVTFNFCGVPLIVVRGQDSKIRAFINSCPTAARRSWKAKAPAAS